MKKKNKIAFVIACSILTIVGGASSYSTYQTEGSCFILLDGVEAVADAPEEEQPTLFTCKTNENLCPKGSHNAICYPTNPGETDYSSAFAHCKPQGCHTNSVGICDHGASTSHYSSYCACVDKSKTR